MSNLDIYRSSAHAWLESCAGTYGREARRGLSVEDDLALGRRYQRAKFDAGYAGINWATEVGGQGLTHIEKITFDAEEMSFGMPSHYFGISLGMPIPILIRYGEDKEWMKERVLAALKGEEIWCQLFSEPAGGSDLAGLRTRAEPDGNGWKMNGQKVWTSWAQYCDYGVIVVRTDPTVPKHKGLTYFWVDMKAPGVEVRPIKLAGGDSHVNEVFFDDVRMEDSQRMSPVGGGFGVALTTLMIERYIATDSGGFGPHLDEFVALARSCEVGGKPALSDARIRQQIARNFAMRAGLESITTRAMLMMQAGMVPGPEGSQQAGRGAQPAKAVRTGDRSARQCGPGVRSPRFWQGRLDGKLDQRAHRADCRGVRRSAAQYNRRKGARPAAGSPPRQGHPVQSDTGVT